MWAADAGIRLDTTADLPLGVQLDWGIRAAIAAGRLQAGERLPALRDLADELGVNHNTLRAAVAKLEADGLLERRHGSGTFVAADAVAHERLATLVAHAEQLAADAGLDARELAAALYARAGTAPARRGDPAAAERRVLREDIAVLERVLAQIEPPLAPRPTGTHARPRVLDADGLREQRDALIHRIAAVQQAAGADPQDAAQPAAEPRRAPRPKPVPRAQPT